MSARWTRLSSEFRDECISVPGARVEQICEPSSVSEVCELVSDAAAERAGLLISGGRTRLGLANPARPLRLGLSLACLSGIDEFVPDEGVLHARAGTPLAEIREVVRAEGWELPLDSPGPRTTVGGTVASAVTGPRAQTFGSVSDAILGLDVVGGDGVASKCGGRVVKNVTGYDLAKLYCGSFGSLAVVTGAWLRLRPAASTCRAYRVQLPNDRECFETVRRLAALGSVRALVWSERPDSVSGNLLLELAGSKEGVAHDAAAFASTFSSASFPTGAPGDSASRVLEEIAVSEIDFMRDARVEATVESEPVALRVRVLGSRCEAMRRVLLGAGLRVSIDLGLGVLHGRGVVGSAAALDVIRGKAEESGGFATFEQMPEAWRNALDVFGPLGGTEELVATLKAKLDPADILNPGRFVAVHEGGRAS